MGTLVINNPTTWNNLSIRMVTGSKIIVDNNFTLTNSYVTGCGSMWYGIEANFNKYIDLRNNVIKDAEFGVLLKGGNTFRCEYNSFRDNYIGVSVGSPFDPYDSDVIIHQNFPMIGDTFLCTGSLPNPILGQYYYPSWPTTSSIPYNLPYAGIFVSGTLGFTIGMDTPESAKQWNIFNGLRNGVVSYHSVVQVAGSRFSDFVGDYHVVDSDLLDINQSGVYSINSYIKVINCKYSNLRNGVTSFSSDIEIRRNKITLSDPLYKARPTGIYIETPTACLIQRDTIINAVIGINMNVGFVRATVTDNRISCDADLYGTTGILLTRWSSPTPGFTRVEKNIVEFETGYTSFGIRALYSSRLAINQNTVYFLGSETDVNNNTGINVEGITYSEIRKNFIIGHTAYLDEENAALRFTSGSFNTLFCNYSTLLDNGFVFSALALNTRFVAQAIDEHNYGLVLNAPVIMGTQRHYGNRWQGSSYVLGAYINGVTNGDILATAFGSKFLVDPNDAAPGVLLPAYGPPIATDWFQPESGSTLTCATNFDLPPDDEEYESILLEEYDFETYNDEMEWMKDYYIYLALLDDLTLLSNVTLSDFFDAQEEQPIGQLATVYTKMNQNFYTWTDSLEERKLRMDTLLQDIVLIDSILTHHPSDSVSLCADRVNLIENLSDSFDLWQVKLNTSLMNRVETLEDIQEYLAEITPTNALEENLLIASDLQLSYCLGTSPNSGERTDLLGIATQCIWQGGPGVIESQVLYSNLQDTTFSYNPFACQELELRYRSSQPTNSIDFKVVPNPGTGIFTISYNSGLMENTSYFVTDIFSRVVASGLFTNLDGTVDISSLPDGIYFLHFQPKASTEMVPAIKILKQQI